MPKPSVTDLTTAPVSHAELIDMVKALRDAGTDARSGREFPQALIDCADRVVARADAMYAPKPNTMDADFAAFVRDLKAGVL